MFKKEKIINRFVMLGRGMVPYSPQLYASMSSYSQENESSNCEQSNFEFLKVLVIKDYT